MKKKILFIITHLELGGAQKQLLSLIKKLNPEEYSLSLCVGNCGYLNKDFTDLSFLNIKLIPELVRNINPFYDFIAFVKLYSYIRRNKFDLFHTHSPKASILGRWAAYLSGARKIIYTVHGWPFHRFQNPLLYRIYLFLEKLTAKITKKIIVVSHADLSRGVKNKVALPEKFAIIHYGVDIELADSIFLKRKFNCRSDNLIANISCLKPQKGLFYFLEAAKLILEKLPDIKFSIVGDGPLHRRISREITKRKLTGYVFLDGWTDDVFGILSQISILVISSLWEGLPLAVIEAVASGVPVVATDTGGVSDILDNCNNGIVVKCKDAKTVADAVFTILANHRQWNEKVIAAREKLDLRYWSDERMVSETERIYQEVLT